MERGFVLDQFRKNLKFWYADHGRDMPWVNESDPYKIWLSEVILQQTRVAQGWNYYNRFIDRFPNVFELAASEEDEVLKLWQGLGYYSRARNILKTARIVVEKYEGKFPAEMAALLALPGIGPYTAAAISSFAFKVCVPVLDGNVYRVLSRILDDHSPIDESVSQKYYCNIATEALDPEDSSGFNQAIMDFGATQCVPKQPNCEICIMGDFCQAKQAGTVEILPIKLKKTKIRKRELHFVWINNLLDQHIIERREAGDIWEGLYQPIVVEETSGMVVEESVQKKYGITIKDLKWNYKVKHVLTHQKLELNFYSGMIEDELGQKISGLKLCNPENLKNFAFPKPLAEYIEKNIYL